MHKSSKTLVAVLMVALIVVLGGCGTGKKNSAVDSTQAQQPKTATPATDGNGLPQTAPPALAGNEQAVAPEKNPVGDIPDSQAFVKYSSPSGKYEVSVPEGWSRMVKGTDVSFTDKLDGLQVGITASSTPLSVQNILNSQVAELKKTGRAVVIRQVKAVQLQGGPAVLAMYESNSEPDSVTGKQVRLENERYYFEKNGRLAALTVWAPLGADNVDQWKSISNSFRWR